MPLVGFGGLELCLYLYGIREPMRAQYLDGSGPMRVLHSDLSVVVELAEVGSLMMKDDRLEDIGLWPDCDGDSWA